MTTIVSISFYQLLLQDVHFRKLFWELLQFWDSYCYDLKYHLAELCISADGVPLPFGSRNEVGAPSVCVGQCHGVREPRLLAL